MRSGLASQPTPASNRSGRRLTDDERRALQERRRARTDPPARSTAGSGRSRSGAVATEEVVPARTTAARSVAIPRLPGAKPKLTKPVPKMPPRSRRQETIRSRAVAALGAVLVVGLAVIALAGGRLLGGAGGEDSGGGAGRPTTLSAAFPTPGPPATPPPAATPAPTAPPDIAAAFGGRVPVVCLDPGHGGEDAGFTRSPLDPLYLEEQVLVLQHAWDLEFRLEQRGFDVVMTRNTDTAVNAAGRDVNGDGRTARDDRPGTKTFRNLDELQARIDVCNEAGADLLVSMHVNGFTNPAVRGYETWYTPGRPFSDRSEAFACLAYTQLKRQLGQISYAVPPEIERGCNPDSTIDVGDPQRAQAENFIVTGPEVPGKVPRPSRMPGAIVEALFLSNDQDASVLASPGGREAIVNAYENAILAWFEEFPPGTNPPPEPPLASPVVASPVSEETPRRQPEPRREPDEDQEAER